MKITKDKALIFSAILLVIYTIICIIQEFMGIAPDSTLTGCFFVAFGVAEGGYCAWIHKMGKDLEKDKDKKPIRSGDITGFDDAEVIDEDEENG